jgi:3-hydroxyacyl-[acyl-carrier-protein] dehydratase
MPGVLIIEAMAQVAGVLVGYSEPQAVTSSRVPLLAGVDNCRFRRQVVPGDQLVIRLEVVRRHGSVWRVAGQACVDGQLAAASQLLVFLGDKPDAEEAQ